MKIFDMKTTFTGGELSPLLHARVDLAQYATGVRSLKNFIILPQGGVTNRPGTVELSHEAYNNNVRLVPFVFSQEDSAVLVFADGVVDVYTYSGQGTRIDSPYTMSHLVELRWLQSADILYLFCPDTPVRMLKRDTIGWYFEEVEFLEGPFRDTNTDDTILMWLELGLDPDTGEWDFNKLWASKPVFKSFSLEGALVKLEQKIKPFSGEAALMGGGEWTVLNVFGPFSYRTNGKWTGALDVERCVFENWSGRDDPADWTWEPFKSYYSDTGAEENFAFSGTVEEYATHFRFKRMSGTNRVVVTFDFEGGLIERIVKIKKITSQIGAIVGAVDGLNGEIPKTDAWALGAFNNYFGYPALGIFHQERLVLANTKSDPQTIWMSQPANWHNFGTSIPTKDEDAITMTLASKQVNEIVGLSSRGDLLIFTSGAEFTAKAGSKTDVFTPASLVVTPSSYRGAKNVPTLDVGNSVLFVQRDGRTVRALGYSLEIDNYSASDLSILAEHLFQGTSIKSWAYQQAPWGIVWVVLGNRGLVSLTLNQDHQITGWGRQDMSGGLIDVCSIPGNGQDDVFFAVERGGLIGIERMRTRNDKYCGSTYFMDAATFPVKSELELLEWEQQVGGTLQGRHKGINVVTIRLHKTCGLDVGVITENNTALDGRVYPEPFTGDLRIEVPGGMGRMCRLRIENNEPRPLTILGVFPEVDVYADGQG